MIENGLNEKNVFQLDWMKFSIIGVFIYIYIYRSLFMECNQWGNWCFDILAKPNIIIIKNMMINLVLALLTCMNVFWSKYVPSLDLLIHRFSRYFLHISLLYFWRFISFQQMWKWVCNSKQHQIFNRCKLKLHILEALRIRSLIQTYFELIHFGKKLVELMEVHSRYAFESLGFFVVNKKISMNHMSSYLRNIF
jgi:hypothetical protein